MRPLKGTFFVVSLSSETAINDFLAARARLFHYQTQGIPARTVARWNEAWVQAGCVQKIRQGHYRKLPAVA